jgi:Tfp pilus assembly protein FimT
MSLAGYSLVELLLCLSLAGVLAGAGAPAFLGARDTARAAGAVDYVAGLLHVARMEALKRHSNVAVRFEADGDDYQVAMYADGNGNGVRAADITSGVDSLVRPRERLGDQFPGVTFGFEDQATTIDADDDSSSRDPIRVGRSRMISFSAIGTSSTGTVYVRGAGHHQLAVRVLGVTGRVRSLAYDFGTGRWQPR